MGKKPKASSKPSNGVLRAASYCRTSGEGQRDNTSIPRQKDANEAFIKYNEWQLAGHYADECKTGSKEEGRDDFQRLMRDAANGKFDIIVVFDIKRFSRDGADIVRNSTFLRTTFGIHVVDTKGQFDTRDRRKTLINYVHAGVSEQERIDIMERMIGGRIRRAEDGLPWTGKPPFGRAFRATGKNQGEWYVTERGEEMRALLTRYADGEPLTKLIKEYSFSSPHVVLKTVRLSQLSGPYYVTFNAPEIDVVDLRVLMATMPEIISPKLDRRVRERMDHNRVWNKEKLDKYLLSGYVFCEKCGRSLTGATAKGHKYYRHSQSAGRSAPVCGFSCLPGRIVEPHALDYLFSCFLDQPAFDAAIKKAMPSDDDRNALDADIKTTEAQFAKVNREIGNLVRAVSEGIDLELLRERQDELKAKKAALQTRLAELQDSQRALPDPRVIAYQCAVLRLHLVTKHKGKDWRKLKFDKVRSFLRHLFGDNTKKAGHGIFVRAEGKKWVLSFKGHVRFDAEVVNGNVRPHFLTQAVKGLNAEIREAYKRAVAEAQYSSDLYCIEPGTDHSLRSK